MCELSLLFPLVIIITSIAQSNQRHETLSCARRRGNSCLGAVSLRGPLASEGLGAVPAREGRAPE
eukprot:5438910-Prymnesium_polylepis.1